MNGNVLDAFSNKIKKKKSEKKYDYQRDSAIEEKDQDRFDHSHYVEVLEDILLKSKTPINVGLYGRWGVGKSSILNLLKKKIQDESTLQNFRYVYVDAWGLSKESLQQDLMVTIHKELDKLDPKDVEDKLYNIKEEFTGNFKDNIRRIGGSFGLFAGIAITTGIILHYHFKIDLTTNSAITAGIAILGAGIMALSLIMKYTIGQSKRIIPRTTSSLKFREMYQCLVDNEEKNLVVVIDNLDRCDDEVAVKLLGIIQTFMTIPKCINILACDDEAIINHLRKVKGDYYTRREGNEFLSKFFQITLLLPPFIGENLDEYATELMDQRNMDFGPLVKLVLISGAVKNPRKINQFLNNVVATFRLAQKKEKAKRLPEYSITKHTAFLTKMIVLRHEWPNFYKMLERDHDLHDKINDRINSNDVRSVLKSDNEKNEDVLEEWDSMGLKEFLKATQGVTVPSVKPFILLNQESYEGKIPEINQFVNAVNGLRIDYVLERLNNSNNDEKEHHINKICAINDQHAIDGAFQALIPTTKVLMACVDVIEDLQLKSMAVNNLGLHLSTLLVDHYSDFDIEKVINVAKEMTTHYRTLVFQVYVGHIEKENKIDLPLLEKLLLNNKDVPIPICDKIEKKISSLFETHENELLPLFEKVLSMPEWTDNNFEPPIDFIRKLITSIAFDNTPEDNQKIKICIKYHNNLHEREQRLFVKFLQNHVKDYINLQPPIQQKIITTINELITIETTSASDEMSQLFNILIEVVDSLPQPPQKQAILSLLLKWLGSEMNNAGN